MAVFCNQLVRLLPPLPVAILLGASVLLPTLLFPLHARPRT